MIDGLRIATRPQFEEPESPTGVGGGRPQTGVEIAPQGDLGMSTGGLLLPAGSLQAS